MIVVGWTDAFCGTCREVSFTKERQKALVERIRKRRYNFNHQDHQFLPYASPVFDDNTTCVFTKAQWDGVMDEAYGDMRRGPRLMPQDVITRAPKNGVLYEKDKFAEEGENNNG